MAEYAYNFIFDDNTISNPDGTIILIDDTNPVIDGYSGRSVLTGDSFFYEEMNRVLNNLHTIRRAHPSIGTLVSFVTDTAGVKFQVTLV